MLRLRHPLSRAISLALALLLCAIAVPATAATSTVASIADAQAKAAEARAKLDIMRKNLASGLAAFDSASNSLASTRAEISANNKRLTKVRASLKSGQRSLDTQAEFLYRTDGAGFVDVLLGARTFDEFAARLSVLQMIAAKDAGLVDQLKQDRAEVDGIVSTLKDREAKQQALVTKVGSRTDSSPYSVQGGLNQQQAYLNSLSTQVATLVAAQERAQAAAAAALARAASASGSNNSVGSGPGASQPAPPQGNTKLKLATVTGRGSSWWVMAKDSSTFRPTGLTFSGEASEYGTNDNGTGTSSGRPLRAARLLGVDGIGQVSCEVVQPQ